MKRFLNGERGWITTALTVITAIMVSALFLIWAVFGTQTVNSQNATILQGEAAQIATLETDLTQLVQTNTAGDRTIVCILRLAPLGTHGTPKSEQRSDANVNECLIAAEAGFDNLDAWRTAGRPKR
jgi:hypothetical protein